MGVSIVILSWGVQQGGMGRRMRLRVGRGVRVRGGALLRRRLGRLVKSESNCAGGWMTWEFLPDCERGLSGPWMHRDLGSKP